MSEGNSAYFNELAALTSRHVTAGSLASGEAVEAIYALAETLGKTIAFCGMGSAELTSELLEGAISTITEVAAENQHIGALVGLVHAEKRGRAN